MGSGTGLFCVYRGAALAAALKIPIFTGKAISVNYFASRPRGVKLSYLRFPLLTHTTLVAPGGAKVTWKRRKAKGKGEGGCKTV